MAWYKDGTVTATNGSTAVVGVQTLWSTQAAAGDLFTLDGAHFYEVLSITDDTHLTLASPFLGTTGSILAYAVIRNFTSTTNATLALNLANMINKWHLTLDELLQWLTLTGSVNLTNPATGIATLVKTPSQIQAEWMGSISKAFVATDITLTTAEAGNAFITATGTLTANVNLILPAVQSHLIAVTNNTLGAFTLTVKTPAGTGIVIPQGYRVIVFCDGTNVLNGFTYEGVTAADTHVATSKTTPVDADELPIADSEASFGLKKRTWANLKATLASWINGNIIAAYFTTLIVSGAAKLATTSGNVLIGTTVDDGTTRLQVNGSISSSGALLLTQTNAGMELGSLSVANTPYLDLHTSGNNIDYDVRVIASGGNSIVGQGLLNINATAGLALDGPLQTANYTVASLPAGVLGSRACVTDATAPTYLGALTGGGTVKCPVFYNGTAWVSA